MLDIDESQEFIWELIDECIDNANKITYASYLESQTIPFTINEAKKAMLHLIDVKFELFRKILFLNVSMFGVF